MVAERQDLGASSVIELRERPVERGDELASGLGFERNFMLGVVGHDEDETASDFNLGRRFPEITLTHAYSPTPIRTGECASFVFNLKQQSEKIFSRSSKSCAA